jgi:putative membrane-bound dehydrogenase-like protein
MMPPASAAPTRLPRTCLLLAVLAAPLLAGGGPAGAGKIPRATDAPKPLAPEESRRRFRLPEGFRIELVAAEPQLREPTNITFDERGRIYVCELHGYNLDGYYDVLELNKTGKLDTAVRRIPASKQAEERAAKETYSTIRLLEDTDGNGRVDRSTVFADRLPPCYGLVPARGGVIALCAPDIYFLADRDGDGKAEVREKLFTGFGVGELWTRISNPRWGVDNWIYAACGAGSAGTITGPHLPGPVRLGNTGFRFKPDGSRLEPVSGGTSGYGLALDDWGDRFLCTNQQHALYVAPLPYRALARNPYAPALNPVVNISTYGHPARVFPTSKPDPWRLRRGRRPEWVKFYGPAETSAGLFTSACAPLVYRADLFPPAYRGNHFSCEPAQNLIHRCLLEPRGAGFVARRAEPGKEFLTSTDRWFRPVSLAVGPEGALYVVDMYREIIEDYSAIPRYLQQEYVDSLVAGRDRGRVWRIVAGNAPPRQRTPAAAGPKELVAELGSGNPWRRLTARRLLLERGDRSVVSALRGLCRKRPTPQARLHALYTLDGLGALPPGLIELALGDAHYGVRWNALKLAERRLDREPALLAKVLSLADDPHPKVRLQAAFSLGESQDARVLPALARLARREGGDPWMRAAILSAVPDRAGRLARMLLAADDKAAPSPLLRPLAAVVGARGAAKLEPAGEGIAALLVEAARVPDDGARTDLLTGLAEGLRRGRRVDVRSAAAEQALGRLLKSPSADVRRQVLVVSGLLGLRGLPALRAARAAALKTALDASRPLPERLKAVDLLTDAPPAELAPLHKLLDPRQPINLQLAAVGVLSSAGGPEVGADLLRGWKGYSPRMQTAVLDALFARQDRLPGLLDALKKGTVEPSSLPPLRQSQLLQNPNPAVRDRAKSLLAGRASSEDRKRVLERYRVALKLPRDARRGKEVFEQRCAQCHQLKGRGTAVGPDLAAVGDRPDESVLIDLLDPSSTITVGYRTYTVITRDGKLYTGTLAAETATSVTLRREKGAEDVILRRDIDEMLASPKSLMPEGLEKELSPQDVANLLGYLRRELRPGPGAPRKR